MHSLIHFFTYSYCSPKPTSTIDVPTSATIERHPIAIAAAATTAATTAAGNNDTPVPRDGSGDVSSKARTDKAKGGGSVSSDSFSNGSEGSGGTNASPMSVVELFGGWL